MAIALEAKKDSHGLEAPKVAYIATKKYLDAKVLAAYGHCCRQIKDSIAPISGHPIFH